MYIRIRFAKYGVVKFIGHLDVMRYFQKAVRRSGLAIKYSNGYSPHQLMVFASPLGVGITSDGEIMDIEIEDSAPECRAENPAEAVAETLGKALTEGFEIISARVIPWTEGEKRPDNAMSLVSAADYLVSVKDGYELCGTAPELPVSTSEIKEKFEKYMAQDKIIVSKKTKSGEQELDIKPYIYKATFASGTEELFLAGEEVVHADSYDGGNRFALSLAAGSSVNIKPELVIEDFCNYAGICYNRFAFQIHRGAMYTGDSGALQLL